MDDMDGDDQVFAAEQITKKRLRKGRTEYLVKWKGTYFSIRQKLVFIKEWELYLLSFLLLQMRTFEHFNTKNGRYKFYLLTESLEN